MLLGSKSRYSKATPGRFPDKKPIKFSYILTMFNQHRDFPEIKSHITPDTMLSSLLLLSLVSTQNIRKNYCCRYFAFLHCDVSSKSTLSVC